MSATRGHFFCFVHFDGGIFPGKFCHVRETDNGRRGADQKTRSHPAPIRTRPGCRSARPLPQDHKRRREYIRISNAKTRYRAPQEPRHGIIYAGPGIYAGMSKEAIQGPGAADVFIYHAHDTHNTHTPQIQNIAIGRCLCIIEIETENPAHKAQEEKTNV